MTLHHGPSGTLLVAGPGLFPATKSTQDGLGFPHVFFSKPSWSHPWFENDILPPVGDYSTLVVLPYCYYMLLPYAGDGCSQESSKFQIYGLHIKDFEGKDQTYPKRNWTLWKICGRSVVFSLGKSLLNQPCFVMRTDGFEPAQRLVSSSSQGSLGSPLAHSLWCPKPDGASKCSYFSASINLNQKKPEDRIVTSLVRPSSVSQGSQVVSPLFWLHAAHYDGGASASGSRVMGLHHVPITRSPVSRAVQLRFQSSRVTSHPLFIGVSSSVHKHQGFTEVLLRRSAESSNVPTSSTPRRPNNRSI